MDNELLNALLNMSVSSGSQERTSNDSASYVIQQSSSCNTSSIWSDSSDLSSQYNMVPSSDRNYNHNATSQLSLFVKIPDNVDSIPSTFNPPIVDPLSSVYPNEGPSTSQLINGMNYRDYDDRASVSSSFIFLDKETMNKSEADNYNVPTQSGLQSMYAINRRGMGTSTPIASLNEATQIPSTMAPNPINNIARSYQPDQLLDEDQVMQAFKHLKQVVQSNQSYVMCNKVELGKFIRWCEALYAPFKVKAQSINICVFCKNNNEKPEVYNTHRVKDNFGIVSCPILRRYICKVCHATGDNAHTMKYCPRVKSMGFDTSSHF